MINKARIGAWLYLLIDHLI